MEVSVEPAPWSGLPADQNNTHRPAGAVELPPSHLPRLGTATNKAWNNGDCRGRRIAFGSGAIKNGLGKLLLLFNNIMWIQRHFQLSNCQATSSPHIMIIMVDKVREWRLLRTSETWLLVAVVSLEFTWSAVSPEFILQCQHQVANPPRLLKLTSWHTESRSCFDNMSQSTFIFPTKFLVYKLIWDRF